MFFSLSCALCCLTLPNVRITVKRSETLKAVSWFDPNETVNLRQKNDSLPLNCGVRYSTTLQNLQSDSLSYHLRGRRRRMRQKHIHSRTGLSRAPRTIDTTKHVMKQPQDMLQTLIIMLCQFQWDIVGESQWQCWYHIREYSSVWQTWTQRQSQRINPMTKTSLFF